MRALGGKRQSAPSWMVMAVLLCAPASFGQNPPRVDPSRVSELMQLADANRDDWQSEIDADRATKVLHQLMDVLASPDGLSSFHPDQYFDPDAIVFDLRPAGASTVRIVDQQVQRWRFDAGQLKRAAPAAAFKALRGPHTGRLRMHAKVVAVRSSGDDAFATDVRVENFSQGSEGRCEQTASWTVRWHRGAGDQPPHITEIKPVRMSEVRSPAAQFVDCSGGVIQPSDWTPQLLEGAYWWYGRTDSLGGISFTGREGIAVGDINGDGLDDLYVCMPDGLPNKLFFQRPDGTVGERAYAARVPWLDRTSSALILDMDNDGDQDLVCAIGQSIVLSLNDGSGVLYWKCSWKAPTPEHFYSMAAADYDADGDLDIYGCRYVKTRYGAYPPEPYHDANNGSTNFLLRNDGAERFTDVTESVGMNVNNQRFSLAASWIDYDDDGDMDLYVANDFGRNNLYRNDGGRFVDVAAQAGAEDQASGMGTSWSDYDGDGDFDLLVSNMFSSAGRRVTYQPRAAGAVSPSDATGLQHHSLGNTLLANKGDGTFEDQSERAGIRMGRWAWGAKFIDINNDGFEDMVVPNGWLTNETTDDL